MTESIRIGIIGTSWWADFGHLPLLTSDDRTKVVAICGHNRERTEAEYRTLFRDAGFELTNIVPTPAGPSVVEAVPV